MLFVLPVTKENMNIPKSYQVKQNIECLSIKCFDHAGNAFSRSKLNSTLHPIMVEILQT